MSERLIPVLLALLVAAVACAPKVEVSAKEPIVINMNIKIEHELRIKVEKEVDDLFSENEDIFGEVE
jgi:hypothetical protein